MPPFLATPSGGRVSLLAASKCWKNRPLSTFVSSSSGQRSSISFVTLISRPVAFSSNHARLSSISYSYQQTRNNSRDSRQSPESFTRKEVAKSRHEKEQAGQKEKAEQKQMQDKGSETTTKGSKDRIDNSKKDDETKDDPRKKAVEGDIKTFRPARLPVVLCHGFSGFDSLGQNPDFRFDYWRGVRHALEDIGCTVHAARVPPFASIEQRAEKLRDFIEQAVPHGSELNLVGHSMGGLDCRYMISHLKSPHFTVKSLTTLATPHHGSSFADYVMTDIVGVVRLEAFWTMLNMVGIERGAAVNLTTYYLRDEFNPRTPNDPNVEYFSYAASFQPGFFSRFRFPWQVIMAREGPNDGLVSVESAKWGTFVRTIPNADHMDLMNWINALAWSRARFPWILGGSSHDPEGRSKGAFETDNDEEGDRDQKGEKPPLFNAIELYLEISDMLHENGL